MPNNFFRFIISASDVGIEKYDTLEIAELMRPVAPIKNDSLFEFAQTVSCLFVEPTYHQTQSSQKCLPNTHYRKYKKHQRLTTRG